MLRRAPAGETGLPVCLASPAGAVASLRVVLDPNVVPVMSSNTPQLRVFPTKTAWISTVKARRRIATAGWALALVCQWINGRRREAVWSVFMSATLAGAFRVVFLWGWETSACHHSHHQISAPSRPPRINTFSSVLGVLSSCPTLVCETPNNNWHVASYTHMSAPHRRLKAEDGGQYLKLNYFQRAALALKPLNSVVSFMLTTRRLEQSAAQQDSV